MPLGEQLASHALSCPPDCMLPLLFHLEYLDPFPVCKSNRKPALATERRRGEDDGDSYSYSYSYSFYYYCYYYYYDDDYYYYHSYY